MSSLVLRIAGAALLFSIAGSSRAAPVASARMSWTGACDDPAALRGELADRGVQFSEPTSRSSQAISASVFVVADAAGLTAELAIADVSGARETRRVQAKTCGELRAAVAWVLLVLARERQTESAPSDASAPNRTSPPLGSTRFESSPKSTLTPTGSIHSPQISQKRTSPLAVHRELRLGTAFLFGSGFVPAPALGPSLFLEHRWSSQGFLGLRLSAFQLTNLPFSEQDISLSVQRLAARISIVAKPPRLPVTVSVGAEGGHLSGSGSGPGQQPSHENVPWLALDTEVGLEFQLIRGVLAAQIGSGLGFSPLRYSFRNGTSGQVLSSSGPVEFRLQAGLSVGL